MAKRNTTRGCPSVLEQNGERDIIGQCAKSGECGQAITASGQSRSAGIRSRNVYVNQWETYKDPDVHTSRQYLARCLDTVIQETRTKIAISTPQQQENIRGYGL